MLPIAETNLQTLLNDIYQMPANITEHMVIERLADRYRWPQFYDREHGNFPTVERIVDNGVKLQDFFCDDGYIDSEKLINFYHDGYTIIISGVQYLFQDITTISNRLSIEFGKEINANIYLSKGTKIVSFPVHQHEYSVIVKNVFGASKWKLNNKEHMLENKNVFFIEKFNDHGVTEIYDKKCSITFNLY